MRFPGLSAHTREHFRRDGRAKVAYPTKTDAETAAAKAHARAYRCRFCGAWHIGGET